MLINIYEALRPFYMPHHCMPLVVNDVRVLTVYSVTQKIRHLRTYYGKLLRDGSKKKKKRGNQWPFFDQMEFLRDHMVSRMTRPLSTVRIRLLFCGVISSSLDVNLLN